MRFVIIEITNETDILEAYVSASDSGSGEGRAWWLQQGGKGDGGAESQRTTPVTGVTGLRSNYRGVFRRQESPVGAPKAEREAEREPVEVAEPTTETGGKGEAPRR